MAGDEVGNSLLDVINAINGIGNKLDVHIAKMDETQRKTDHLYKMVVTGNGIPSIMEDVRNLKKRNETADWIVRIIGGAVLADLGVKLWQILK